MSNAFERGPRGEVGFFGGQNQPSLLDQRASPHYCPALHSEHGIDPKSPVHAQVHSHWVDDIAGVHGQATTGVGSNRFEHMSRNDAALAATGLPFDVGDFLLEHGGQMALDAAGFIPGVNVATEWIQGGYHGLHSLHDALRGDTKEAEAQASEAAWHAASGGLNMLTSEGGKEMLRAHHLYRTAEAMETVEDVHKVVEGVEATWDSTATLHHSLGGKKEDLPFFGSLAPWIAAGAGREEQGR